MNARVRLSEEELELLPSEGDVAFYESTGGTDSKKVIPDRVLDEALGGAEAHFQGDRDWVLPITTGFADWKPEDGDVLRNAQAVALQNRKFQP